MTSLTFGSKSLLTSIDDLAFDGCESLTSVDIPDSVTTIGKFAFNNCTSMKSIAFGTKSLLKNIGAYAFNNCGLTSIDIPDRVTAIGDGVFCDCTDLTTVTFPDRLESIDDYAFCNCTSLDTIRFGAGIVSIGSNAFCVRDDYGIVPTEFHDADENKIDLSDSKQYKILQGNTFTGDFTVMTFAEEGTFVYRGIVYKISDSNSNQAYVCRHTNAIRASAAIRESVPINGIICKVTSIGEGAFANCKALASITIPSTIKSIGDEVFYGCERLASVTIPASVESIGDCAFAKCSSLEWIKVEGGNDHYSSIDGVLFDKDVKTLIQYPPSKEGDTYSIPDTVTSIGMQAFRICESLTSVTIPESVTYIDDEAFQECHGLTSISIPSKVTTIHYATFYGCTSLVSVRIPDTVKTIEAYAFADCTGLTIIHFGNGLIDIDPDMFGSFVDDEFTATAFYDENGDELSIPSDIEKFKGTMFTGNIFKMNMRDETIIIVDGIIYKALESTGEAYVCGYTTDIGSNPTILDSVTFDDRDYPVTYIDERAFTHCKVLASIKIPDTVRSIEKEAFYRCTGLISVSIPNSVASIGEKAFKDCKALASVTIPASVSSIGEYAFAKCRSLEWIEVDRGNSSYCSVDGVLFDKDMKTLIQYPPNKAVSSYSIPDTVVSIGAQAFRMCDILISVAMPESVTSIGIEAFEECRSLASVSISSQVKTVPYEAFYGCTSLASVTIPDTVETIEKYAFADCTGLKTICFGNGLTDVDPDMLGRFVGKDDFTATRFFDENGNELSLSDIENFRGKTFTGDICEMNVVLEVRTITFFDGTSYWTYIGYVGDEVPRPADPVREGYEFLYWADEDGNEFDWIVPAKDITVTAQWKSVDPSGDDDDYNDDDDDYYPSGGPDHKSGISNGSAKVLIIAACVAAFMAVLLAFTTYETKR